jgi:hypothetical protein
MLAQGEGGGIVAIGRTTLLSGTLAGMLVGPFCILEWEKRGLNKGR